MQRAYSPSACLSIATAPVSHDRTVCVQINLTGFLERNTGAFSKMPTAPEHFPLYLSFWDFAELRNGAVKTALARRCAALR